MEATKSEQQSAIERTAVEITAVLDQMHAHDHEQEVLRSLRQSLNESFVRFSAEVAASFENLTTLENDLNRLSMDVIAHENMNLEAAQALEKLTREIEETRLVRSRLHQEWQDLASQ